MNLSEQLKRQRAIACGDGADRAATDFYRPLFPVIVRMSDDGLSQQEIASRLNKDGLRMRPVRRKGEKEQQAGRFHDVAIGRLLKRARRELSR